MTIDHLITNFALKDIKYDWDFLQHYQSAQFDSEGKIVVGYPDHAILDAVIDLRHAKTE